MAKTHRGKPLRRLYKNGRGKCPVCNRTGVKLLYTRVIAGVQTSVCKRCQN